MKGKPEFEKIATDIGKLVAEKNIAYGDSFSHTGDIIKLLFPEGIPPGKYEVFLALVRIMDKIFRLATNPDYNNENAWADIAGYCVLMLGYESEKHDSRIKNGEEIRLND
jgi:hypothetical protein